MRGPGGCQPRFGVCIAALAFLVTLAPGAAPAQQAEAAAVLRGLVTDQDGGAPVAGAQVFLDDRTVSVTDAAGRFVVSGIEPAQYRLSVRAVGFQPFEVIVSLADPKTYEVELPLQPGALALEALTVEALRLPRNRVGDIIERMAWGRGDFITREEVEQWETLETSALLSQSRKVNLNHLNVGECLDEAMFGTGAEASVMGGNVTASSSGIPGSGSPCSDIQGRSTVQVLMGRGFRRCQPSIFLDGVRFKLLPGTQVDDIIAPHDIELIEIYGEFEVPGEFSNADVGCGVIAIWTRVG